MPRKSARRPRRRVQRKRRGARRLANSEFASLKETHTFLPLTTNNALYDYATSLARFSRACQVAQGYREYRITKVTYRFKPAADTFATGGQSTIPYLYAMIDKTGSMRDFNTKEEIMSAGAKARRLDDKSLVVSFKPATLSYNYDESGTTNAWAKPIVSPWLSCDRLNDQPAGVVTWMPSSIDHLGLAWIVVNEGTPIGYTLEQTVHIQFRKPSWTVQVKDPEAPKAAQVPSKIVDSGVAVPTA